MRRAVLFALALWLAGCASVSRVDGDAVVNDRLAVHLTAAWNKVSDPIEADPYDTWTQEGLPIDHLRIWGGVRDGQPLMTKPMVYLREPDQKARRIPTFRAGMSPEKIVNLFEMLYGTAGAVTVTRMDPTMFAGQKGVRFEFTLARRADDLTVKGVGWAAVRRDAQGGEELYAATFVAPRLAFFDRLVPLAEQVVKTARVVNRAGSPPSSAW